MNRPVIGISMNYMKLGSHHQYHIRAKYIDAVYDYGGLPLPIPCLTDEDALRQYVSRIDGLIIIGGMDYPPALYGEEVHPQADIMDERRAVSDQLLFKVIRETLKPVIGICAGMQLLNICTGGKLIQHMETTDNHFGEKYHEITLTKSRWLSQIVDGDKIIVNSNHHQGINPDYVGHGFTVVATAYDGVIEAMELEGEQMVLGIQWHPERITDLAHRKRLFEFFINKAGQ